MLSIHQLALAARGVRLVDREVAWPRLAGAGEDPLGEHLLPGPPWFSCRDCLRKVGDTRTGYYWLHHLGLVLAMTSCEKPQASGLRFGRRRRRRRLHVDVGSDGTRLKDIRLTNTTVSTGCRRSPYPRVVCAPPRLLGFSFTRLCDSRV